MFFNCLAKHDLLYLIATDMLFRAPHHVADSIVHPEECRTEEPLNTLFNDLWDSHQRVLDGLLYIVTRQLLEPGIWNRMALLKLVRVPLTALKHLQTQSLHHRAPWPSRPSSQFPVGVTSIFPEDDGTVLFLLSDLIIFLHN